MPRPTRPGMASHPQGRSPGNSGSIRRAGRTSPLTAGQTPRGESRGRNARPCDVPQAAPGRSACGDTHCRMESATPGREAPCAPPCIPTRRTKLRSRRACNAHRPAPVPCRHHPSRLAARQMGLFEVSRGPPHAPARDSPCVSLRATSGAAIPAAMSPRPAGRANSADRWPRAM